MRIKETSIYKMVNSKGKIIKIGFKDIEDAIEHGVNYLLNSDETSVTIIGEITLKKRLTAKERRRKNL